MRDRHSEIALKNFGRECIWGMVLLSVAVCLSGCSQRRVMDLTSQRQEGIQADLAILRPKEQIRLPEPLTPENAVKIGLENNLDLRVSRIMAQIADDDVLAQKLRMLPNLNLQIQTSQDSDYNDLYEDKTSNTATASLTWDVLDFGLSRIRVKQRILDAESRRMERLRQAQKLTLDIVSAYWKLAVSEQSLERIRGIRKDVKEMRDRAMAMVAQKRLDPFIGKSLEKSLVDLDISESNITAERNSAKVDLCNLMGIHPSTRVVVDSGAIKRQLASIPDPEALDPEQLELISLHNRLEFYSADLDIMKKRNDAKMAFLAMFPNLSFSYSQSYDDDSHLVNNYWWTIGASLAYQLLSLPAKWVDYKSRKKAIQMTEAQRLLLTGGIIAQTHVAFNDFVGKSRLYHLHEQSYAIAEDLLEMNREKNKAGRFSDMALTKQMLDTVVNRVGRDAKLMELAQAWARLLVTLGLDYHQWNRDLNTPEAVQVPEDIDQRDIPGMKEKTGESQPKQRMQEAPGMTEGPPRAQGLDRWWPLMACMNNGN